MSIRIWRKNDLPRLAEIAEQAMPFAWDLRVFQDCLKKSYVGWALEEEKKIIGFAIILVHADQVEIINIALLPIFQKKGKGRELFSEIMKYCEECKILTMTLEVRKSNRSAIAFYRKFGFKEVGIRKNYYPLENGREDGLIFTLSKWHGFPAPGS